MEQDIANLSLPILLVGAVMVLAILVREGCERIGLPALVGYLVMGLGIALAHDAWGFLGTDAFTVFEFLGGIGIVLLLFRVGIESDAVGLASQLGRAGWVWIGNVGLSAVLGYLAARHLLDFALVPSLFMAAALSATSLGVCVEVWRGAGRLGTPTGELVVDVAELDDISGVVLMAVVLAVAPALHAGANDGLLPAIGGAAGLLVLKAALFGAACFAFARYVERPMTRAFHRLDPAPDPTLMILGIGVIIAAAADWLGFSLAIGAFFAGLAFSRDPDAIKDYRPFNTVCVLFIPFFFIDIGLSLEVGALAAAAGAGAILALVAILGKVAGAGLPAIPGMGMKDAALVGVSMVPRAEIAMVIASGGAALGEWAVPPEAFGAVVVVAIVTSLLAPPILRFMLQRWRE
jgi:Kef-type K+ transport system membrane component KefB